MWSLLHRYWVFGCYVVWFLFLLAFACSACIYAYKSKFCQFDLCLYVKQWANYQCFFPVRIEFLNLLNQLRIYGYAYNSFHIWISHGISFMMCQEQHLLSLWYFKEGCNFKVVKTDFTFMEETLWTAIANRMVQLGLSWCIFLNGLNFFLKSTK